LLPHRVVWPETDPNPADQPVPFATSIKQTLAFLSTFFTHVFLATQTASPAFVLPAKTSRRDREAVERVFVKSAPHGSLLKGLGYYLEAHGEELVEKARKKLGDAEKAATKFGLKIAADTLSVGGIVDV
jgi:nucleolar MIF4G domain-containing protein 1